MIESNNVKKLMRLFGEPTPLNNRVNGTNQMEPEVGFEPTTCCLQNSCSNQLSYSGKDTAYYRIYI